MLVFVFTIVTITVSITNVSFIDTLSVWLRTFEFMVCAVLSTVLLVYMAWTIKMAVANFFLFDTFSTWTSIFLVLARTKSLIIAIWTFFNFITPDTTSPVIITCVIRTRSWRGGNCRRGLCCIDLVQTSETSKSKTGSTVPIFKLYSKVSRVDRYLQFVVFHDT